jgi:hypothetical protein
MICHSKSAIYPAPQDVITTTRWNNICLSMEVQQFKQNHPKPVEECRGELSVHRVVQKVLGSTCAERECGTGP